MECSSCYLKLHYAVHKWLMYHIMYISYLQYLPLGVDLEWLLSVLLKVYMCAAIMSLHQILEMEKVKLC